MKKLSHILLGMAVLGSGILAGCYDDKGNYDYRDINEMTVTVLAKNQDGREMLIGEDGYCRYKQPSSTDTLWVTYTPEVKQSERNDESNLEYSWRIGYTKDNKYVVDTVSTKELTLTFPPQRTTAYSVVFSVTDLSTNLSFYQSLQITTVKPYINSWLVLNGAKGDRRISAVEEPDSSAYIFTADAYMDLGYETFSGSCRFSLFSIIFEWVGKRSITDCRAGQHIPDVSVRYASAQSHCSITALSDIG